MIRKIIKIDADKCNGCSLCAKACHEGAIGIIDGKAVLLRDDYCDGLGNCLPVCPTGAISFEEREALAFDEDAVMKNKKQEKSAQLPCGCPGSRAKIFERESRIETPKEAPAVSASELGQWPVQLQLIPVNASYFHDAHLLVAADCAAYAHGSFHQSFMRGKVTVIGCPKLDHAEYAEKLTAILKTHSIRSVTIVRMEVPCCSGIEHAAIEALKNCGKMIPWQVITLSVEGKIL